MTPRSIRQAYGPYAKLHVQDERQHWAVTLFMRCLVAAVAGALTGLVIVLPAMYL